MDAEGPKVKTKQSVLSEKSTSTNGGSISNLAPEITNLHSVVKFQSWALFTNFKSNNWNEVGRDLREDCCE